MHRMSLSSLVFPLSVLTLDLLLCSCMSAPMMFQRHPGYLPPLPHTGKHNDDDINNSNNVYNYNNNHLPTPPFISSLSSSDEYWQGQQQQQQQPQLNDLIQADTLGVNNNNEVILSSEQMRKDPLGFQLSSGGDMTNVETLEPFNIENEKLIDSIDLLRKQIERVKEEDDIELKTELLEKLLTDYPDGPLPVVYVEQTIPEPSVMSKEGEGAMDKRSGRYYRRYPWKRQQKGKGSSYDPDARYICTPTREEIFRLLVGLHETHRGNHKKQVNFCNRKRPAKSIFTNIRFLG